jgi:aminomethyltransferase
MSQLLRTPLYDWHVAHGARMVEFGGWEMPVQYAGIVEEHRAVRTAAGLFDISHMGRLAVRGAQALDFLQHLLTCRVDDLAVNHIRYALICRSDGGVLDDVLVGHGEDYGLVVNAGNRSKIVAWIEEQRGESAVELLDRTEDFGMLALQGPVAQAILQGLTPTDLSMLTYYRSSQSVIAGFEVSISRTGYTGEDGFELIVSNTETDVERLADVLLETGQPLGLKPCGLGARDTLRLEAAMPLYGHELTEDIDPFTAGLEFAVKFDKPEFIGKAALAEIAKKSNRRTRVGLELTGKRIAREGAVVLQGEQVIGAVTSGTFSPTLEKSIAMAYITPTAAAVGTPLEVDIRGKREPATIVRLPFYKRPKP